MFLFFPIKKKTKQKLDVFYRYRSMASTIRELRATRFMPSRLPQTEAPIIPARPVQADEVETVDEEFPTTTTPLQQRSTVRIPSKKLWKSLHQV